MLRGSMVDVDERKRRYCEDMWSEGVVSGKENGVREMISEASPDR